MSRLEAGGPRGRYLLTYLRGWLPLDPAHLATRTSAAVLILQGDSDQQISADRDALRLAAALRERAGAVSRLVAVDGASHNFKRVAGPTDHGITGPVMPEAMDALLRWVAETL
jgi:pimeloyl-ACP methyl ester carboxylesterase